MDIQNIFERLTQSEPVNLTDLPEEFGIYALWDHERKIRYIGSTPKNTEGFRTRIYSKHATGSEGRSHKFSQAYCVGRIWRYCKKLHDPAANREQSAADTNAAKKLRNAFIRRYCAASYVSIPRDSMPEPYFASLTSQTVLNDSTPSTKNTYLALLPNKSFKPTQLRGAA